MDATTATAPRIFRISTNVLPDLLERLTKLNRRATKLGLLPIVLTTQAFEDVVDPENDALVDRYALVTVTGDTPVLAGWHLLAVLTHVEGETLLSVVPGCSVSPLYRGTGPVCDHCHTARIRHETFIVANEAGETKQVGRDCLRDFLGGMSPEAMVAWFELFNTALAEAEQSEGHMAAGDGRRLFALDRYLSVVAMVIRCDGWLGRTAAHEQDRAGAATADRALDFIFNPGDRQWAGHAVTDEDKALAATAIDWARAIDLEQESSDYLNNVAVLARLGAVPSRMLGVAASIIRAYQHTLEQAQERKQAAHSEFVSRVGAREVFILKVLSVVDLDTQFGTSRLHLMADDAGNRFKWFASSERIEPGQQVYLKGTVKAHEVYKDIKYTQLTRCKVQ